MARNNHVTRRIIRHELKLRLVRVLRVSRMTPRVLRITLGGDELDGFVSAAHDDHVKLFFPEPGQDKPVLPTLSPQGPVYPEGAAQPVVRNYTPRRYDPEANELTIDFVTHGDGPAARWAAQASPGQYLGVGGPRGSLVLTREFDWYLFAGDEAALPAISRRLEELPKDTRAVVVVEVPDSYEDQNFDTRARVTTTWLHSNGNAPGTTRLLEDAVADLQLPAGEGYAWVGAEASTAKALRRHLVDERGLSKDHIKAAAYWKRGATAVHETYDD